MSDLIERDETIKQFCKQDCGCDPKDCPDKTCYEVEIIESVPTHTTPSNTLGTLDCVDRAEAIKAVKFYETFCDPYPRVIEALEELPSVQPQWIPVSESLPEIKEGHESDVVLCYTDMEAYAFSRLQENIFGQCGFECEREDGYYTSVGEVIAWMPLPEPYKEEQHDD